MSGAAGDAAAPIEGEGAMTGEQELRQILAAHFPWRRWAPTPDYAYDPIAPLRSVAARDPRAVRLIEQVILMRPASSLRECPHCDAVGLGENALAKHIERRHGAETTRRVVLDPGAPRARVE